MWERLIAAVIAAMLSVIGPHASAPTPSTPSTSPARPTVQRFWVRDTHRYTSVWFAGAHRMMIGFGCTGAPYYDPDPRCSHGHGFHHGIDVAMPCGNPLFAGFSGVVVDPSSPGQLGPAYGPYAFRIRSQERGIDVVIGHVRKVYVARGDRVRRGMLIARANKLGAPDGCHLHFEVRPVGGGYEDAVRPGGYLKLER